MSNELNLKEINSVLFVCMGNICRSPTAEVVFRHKVDERKLSIKIDSAGTTGSHARQSPDPRTQKAGIARGYSFDNIRARKVEFQDFSKFDLILAMDEYNILELQKVCPKEHFGKIRLLLEFANNFEDTEVPDPYYGGARGFDYVLDLVEDASNGLLEQIT